MIKLTYTDEMKEQDKLWQTESENLATMERLQKSIVEEAKEKGFKGVAETVTYGNEVVTDLFDNEEEFILERENGDGQYQLASCGYCKPLIEYFEEILNKQ